AAIEAADVVLMTDEMDRLPQVMGVARRVRQLSRQNVAFALGVKVAVLVLAAFGAAGMWAAVFADVGVALLCVLNAMRAMR
ncbi:MAG: heavy metal translocating P-type ATPase, partial [Clostridia bacterium]|nr:heavy metal translocating P-type ATPase [Clostridia bacterium]